MSENTAPSPTMWPADQLQLPSGQCCAFLLEPEVKGKRCGCSHFGLNRSKPGTFCECGHNACYHEIKGETSSASETPETVQLRQRLESLERYQEEWQKTQENVRLLRQRLEDDDDDRDQKVVVRLSQLEDTLEKSQGEVSLEVQKAYNNLGRAWDSITDLLEYKRTTENHLRLIEERLRNADREVARIGDRQLELVDVDITLEERLDAFEDRMEGLERSHGRLSSTDTSRGRLSSTNTESNRGGEAVTRQPAQAVRRSPILISDSRSLSPASSQGSAARSTAASATRSARPTAPIPLSTTAPFLMTSSARTRSPAILTAPPAPILSASIQPGPMAVRSIASSSAGGSSPLQNLWTVHISLMPTSTQPFPFERDTTAYKRCLSRGLHQMVAVNGPSEEAFAQAVNKAFGHIIRNRRWAPLQALSCTAERLAGLPMLRPLDPSLLGGPFDLNFLRDHCAVMDIHGRMDSLYIAMCGKTLSWHSIRRFPVFLESLEPCWAHDERLDGESPLDDNDLENDFSSSEDEIMGSMSRPARPPAGDIVAALSTHHSLKRTASDMSRSSSFGSNTGIAPSLASAPTAPEGEGSRPKVARIYQLDNMVEVRRGVTTL